MAPGEGDVGSDGKSKEGADGQEHGVGGDEGEDEDAERGEDEGAVHHKQRVHKCKIGEPPRIQYLHDYNHCEISAMIVEIDKQLSKCNPTKETVKFGI